LPPLDDEEVSLEMSRVDVQGNVELNELVGTELRKGQYQAKEVRETKTMDSQNVTNGAEIGNLLVSLLW
jgi:hypothetical protein